MLQQDTPDDYVIATGQQYSVRQFVEKSANELGIEIEFKGKGIEEKGIVKSIHGDSCPGIKKGDTIVEVDERYFRPAEVETLLGDPSKAKNKLGWELEITFDQMIAEMIEKDLDTAKKSKLLLDHGYDVNLSLED